MINIYLIEKQKIVREGIKVLLEEEADFQVFLSENKDVQISTFNYFNPDVVLISLDNLDDSDFSYIDIFLNLNNNSNINSDLQKFKVIIYAEKVNEFILNKALNMGCQGYLLKESSIEELKQAIRSVNNGYKHIGNSVFSQVQKLSAASTITVPTNQASLADKQTYLNGFITTNQNGLELENLAKESLKTIDLTGKNITETNQIKTKTNSNLDTSSSLILSPAKSESPWQKFGHTMLFVGLGCIGGIAGVLTMRDRPSFKPLTKYGTINSNSIAIKSSYAGKIERLNHQVGGFVELDEAIAEIELISVRQKQEKIGEIEQQIANIKNKIELKEQLLVSDQAKTKQEQQKIRDLFATQLSRDQFSSNNEVVKTSNDYQNLQDLSQENIISNRELTRAKKVLSDGKNKIQKSKIQKGNLSTEKQTSSPELLKHSKAMLELEEMQNNIEQWQAQISTRKSSIEIETKQLESLQKQLKDTQNSLLDLGLTAIKAPFKGVIAQTYVKPEQIVDEDKTIAEMLNCQNIWIEVNLNYENIRKVNFQQPVLLHLEEYNQDLLGKISSIKPLTALGGESLNLPNYDNSKLESYLDLDNGDRSMLFKVNIDFDTLEDYTQYDEFCGVGRTRLITFNS